MCSSLSAAKSGIKDRPGAGASEDDSGGEGGGTRLTGPGQWELSGKQN